VRPPTSSGRRLGRYHLVEPIGGGPTGEVFRAKVYGVAGFERQFAVKRFYPEIVGNPSAAARLSAAARAYGSLEHPRIARLYEYGVAGGETFTAVELVAGLDLSRLVAATFGSGQPLPAGAALSLISTAARAVGFAHGRGVQHLGLCPTNLIAAPDGEVKVTDFGVLPPRLPPRPADDPSLMARLPYLAPEQLVGEPASAATDVFALGVIAHELVTGERAFDGPTSIDIEQAILSGQPREPQIPRPLVRVLQRCLARSPFERFPDARALADAIDAGLRMAPVPGAKRDVAVLVREALAHWEAMHEQQLSGALNLAMPARPLSAAPPGAGAAVPAPAPRERSATPGPVGRTTMPSAVPPPPQFGDSTDEITMMRGTFDIEEVEPVQPRTSTLSSRGATPPPRPGSMSTPPPRPGSTRPPAISTDSPITRTLPPPGPTVQPRVSQPVPTLPGHGGAPGVAIGAMGTVPARSQPVPTLRGVAAAVPPSVPPAPRDLAMGSTSGESREPVQLPPPVGEPRWAESTPPAPPAPPAQSVDPMASFLDEPAFRGGTQASAAMPELRPEVRPEVLPDVLPDGTPAGHRERADSTGVLVLPGTGVPLPARDAAVPSERPTVTPPRNLKRLATWGLAGLASLTMLFGGGYLLWDRVLSPDEASGSPVPSPTAARDVAPATRPPGTAPVPGTAPPATAPTPPVPGTLPTELAAGATVDAGPVPDTGVAAVAPVPGTAPAAGPSPAPVSGTEAPGATDALAITSTPPGARVYLDGAEQGKTPLTVPGSADRHSLAMVLPGYELHLAEVEGRGAVAVGLKEVTPTDGRGGIKVRCKVKNRYYVFVDGKPSGMMCPTERVGVPLGDHTVEIYDLVSESRKQFPVTVEDVNRSLRVRID
jgi:serine/threonine protein kinase